MVVKLDKFMILGFFIILTVSVLVFHWGMGITLVEAYYFAITTLATVGYGDFNLMNSGPALQIFGTFVMIAGVAISAVIFAILADYALKVRLNIMFGRQKIKMKDHTILISWNKTAQATLEELKKVANVVVLTSKKDAIPGINSKNVKALYASEINEQTLKDAGIDTAANVITCSANDAENVMRVLLVRRMNTQIKIISAANEAPHMKILKHAGADEVISPDVIGGRLLTSSIFEPHVVQLIKDATYVGEGVNIEEVRINKDCKVKDIQEEYQVAVMEEIQNSQEIKKTHRISDLKASSTVHRGSKIIIYGLIDNIKRLQKELGLFEDPDLIT